MWSLKDAEEEVGNIMRDREMDPVSCFSFFFSSCLTFCFFFRVPHQSVQLEEKRSRQYQRVPPRHRLLVRLC